MKKEMKKASPVTFDDLKTLIKETAEALPRCQQKQYTGCGGYN